MEGKHILVSVGHMPPYINLFYKNGKIALKGFLGKIWNILQSRLHFTSELISEDFKDGVFSYYNGHRDVILHPSVISSKDTETFDFTVPLLSSWYSLYIKDSDEANSSESFIRNWSKGLWASTGIMVLIFTFFLYVMLNVSFRLLNARIIDIPKRRQRLSSPRHIHRSQGNNRAHPMKHLNAKAHNAEGEYYKLRSHNEASLGNCFIIALAAFCSQGYNLSTHLASVRTLMITLLIFGMIMCNSYSALLVSQLTLRERFLPFNTLDQIPEEANDYSLCVRQNSLAYTYFKINDTSTGLKKKWAKIVNKKPCVSGVIPPDVMCAPQIAFLETPAIMQESISRNFKCKITHLKGKYYKVELSILLFKGFDSKAKQAINTEIIKYREVGILAHLTKRYVRQDELMSPGEDPVLQVTYDHMQGVLLAYTSCMGVSFILLITEILFKKLSDNISGSQFGMKASNYFNTNTWMVIK